MALLKPAWESQNEAKALESIDKLVAKGAAEEKFAEIAMNEAVLSEVRLAAVERITDQKLLSDIAIKGEDHSVIEAAGGKVINQNYLDLIVKLHYSRSQVGRITDPQILFNITMWASECMHNSDFYDPKKMAYRLESVKAIGSTAVVQQTDQERLYSIAKDERIAMELRNLAVDKLIDEEMIYSIACAKKEDGRPEWQQSNDQVSGKATKKLTNQNRLREIACSGSGYPQAQVAAIEALNDQDVLADIFNQFDDLAVKIAVLKRWESPDESVLIEAAKQNRDDYLHLLILEKLSTSGALAEMALIVDDFVKYKTIIDVITDRNLLRKIAENAGEKTCSNDFYHSADGDPYAAGSGWVSDVRKIPVTEVRQVAVDKMNQLD